MKLIVVGDPHVSAEEHGGRTVDTSDHLRKLVDHVNARHPDADYCLFIGDLTNEGEPEAYERFKRLTDDLKVSPLLMIGNHDNRENFQAAFPGAAKDDNGFVQYSLDLGADYRLITLDTLSAPPYTFPDRHVGFLCPKRLSFLKDKLKTAGGRSVIIAMHHHPFRIGLPGMDAIRLENDKVFMDIVGRFPNVKMLLMGHNHRTISGVVNQLPFSCFRSLDVQTPLNFEALDPNSGIAEPPGYGVVLAGKEGIIIHQEEFTAGVSPESNWETQLKNHPEYVESFKRIVEKMLPEKADTPLL